MTLKGKGKYGQPQKKVIFEPGRWTWRLWTYPYYGDSRCFRWLLGTPNNGKTITFYFSLISFQQSQATNNTESRVLAAQSSKEITAKRGVTGTNFVEHNVISGAESSLSQDAPLNKNNNKKTLNYREQVPNNTQDKTDEYSEVSSVWWSFEFLLTALIDDWTTL